MGAAVEFAARGKSRATQKYEYIPTTDENGEEIYVRKNGSRAKSRDDRTTITAARKMGCGVK